MIRLQDLILLYQRSYHCRFFPKEEDNSPDRKAVLNKGHHIAHIVHGKLQKLKISFPLWNIQKYMYFHLHDVFPSKPLHINYRHNARYLGKRLLQMCSSEGFQWNDFLSNLEILGSFPPGFSALLQSARGTSGWCWSAKEVKRGKTFSMVLIRS